jgi:DNA-binding NtrC family response regulator
VWNNETGGLNVPHVVLLAEDDDATLKGLAACLHAAGYSVVPVLSFAEAHRLMPFVRPDVVVADVRLGKYNGLQLAVQAGALDPPPGVIVTSGFEDSVISAEAQRLGATFLLKPIDPTRLLAVIAKMVNPW